MVRAQLKGEGSPARIAAALALPAAAAGPPGSLAVPGARPPLIRIASPLAGGAGWVVLVCDGAPLADISHPEELGDAADLAVADRAGRVLVGDRASLAIFPPALVRAALAGRVSGAGRFRDRQGAEVLGAYAPVPAAGWVVLSRQPARVAEAVAARLRRRSALAAGAALLLIAALLAAAWARWCARSATWPASSGSWRGRRRPPRAATRSTTCGGASRRCAAA